MRLSEGAKRYEVGSAKGPKFQLRREDIAKRKARIESRIHPNSKIVVRALFKPGRPIVYEARGGHGHPTK